MATFTPDIDDEGGGVHKINCLELDRQDAYEAFFKSSNTGIGRLNVFHSNIRSFAKNVDEITVYLNNLVTQLDVIVFSECWLSGGEGEMELDGFDLAMTTSKQNRNDGVVVYTSKRLSATAQQITLGDVHGIRLDFSYLNKPFNILALYRTFDSNIATFVSSLDVYYERISKDCNCILVGDLNIDILKDNANTDTYLNCLLGYGLVQCIDKPTRVTDHSSTCLDHIFSRYTDYNCVQSAVFQTGVTDHYCTALTISTNTSTSITSTDNSARSWGEWGIFRHGAASDIDITGKLKNMGWQYWAQDTHFSINNRHFN